MLAQGLSGIRRDKGVRTTIPAKDGVRAGDLLNRDFTAPRPDHTWVMDCRRRSNFERFRRLGFQQSSQRGVALGQ